MKNFKYQISNIKLNRKGFTLIEVLVAATIIGLLASVAIGSYSTATKNSRDARRKSDLETIRSAIEIYRADYGRYPRAGCGSGVCPSTNVSNLSGALVSTYIDAIPNDPSAATTTPYKYHAEDFSGSGPFQYCLMVLMENISNANNETGTVCDTIVGGIDSEYNYGVKNP